MIKTVHELSDFERLTDFQQDIFFSWKAEPAGRDLPKIRLTRNVYGIGIGGTSLVVYERLATVSINDVRDAPDPVRGIDEEAKRRILSFEEEVKHLAESHGCRAIAGTLEPSPVSAALSSMLSKKLESLEARVLVVENNYGRALALIEDQVTRVADRTTLQETCLGDHEERLHKVETQELNAIDERLCRLESPPVNEVFSRGVPK